MSSSLDISKYVDGLSIGNVKRVIKSGYNTIPKIIKMEIEDFEKVEGFKSKLSTKIKYPEWEATFSFIIYI